jgi:hypothetical protein
MCGREPRGVLSTCRDLDLFSCTAHRVFLFSLFYLSLCLSLSLSYSLSLCLSLSLSLARPMTQTQTQTHTALTHIQLKSHIDMQNCTHRHKQANDTHAPTQESIVREVAEESGVIVDKASIQYRSSQPWPFPRSLMVAFTARCQPGGDGVTIDKDEMDDVRWFSREEVMRTIMGDTEHSGPLKKIPGRSAIARKLISEWAGGPR